MKGAESAQNSRLRDCKKELLGGMEEITLSPTRAHQFFTKRNERNGGMKEKFFPLRGLINFSQKRKQEKDWVIGQTWMSTILRSGQLSMWFRSSCLLMWWVALKGQITRAFSGNCFHPAGHQHSARRFKGIVHQGRVVPITPEGINSRPILSNSA